MWCPSLSSRFLRKAKGMTRKIAEAVRRKLSLETDRCVIYEKKNISGIDHLETEASQSRRLGPPFRISCTR